MKHELHDALIIEKRYSTRGATWEDAEGAQPFGQIGKASAGRFERNSGLAIARQWQDQCPS